MKLLDYSLPEHLKELPFESKNIRSFQPQDASAQHDRTTTRYHYTSANALMAILDTGNNSGSVRFTDARYMNDRSEHMYFVKLLLEYMEEHKVEYQYCQDVINELLFKDQPYSLNDYLSLRVFEIKDVKIDNYLFPKPRHFLFCMSKNNDSLHMWNYYVHNGYYQGYNLGIRIYDFLKIFDQESAKKMIQLKYIVEMCYTQKVNKKKKLKCCVML